MESAINWMKCIELAAGKEDLAHELLEKFIEDLDVSHSEISKSFELNNYTNLQAEVHKLHGACCYCGVPALKDICKKLESDLKNNQLEQIDQLFEQLSEEIVRVQQSFKKKAFAQP